MNVLIKDIINKIDIKDKEISLKELSKIINKISNNKYTEIKLYKEIISKYKIHIYPISPNEWKIDFPVEFRKIHKQRYANKEQSILIIKELYEKGNIDNIPSFINVPIQHFTLDEMLEFKKEDEMMLRNQDPNDNKETEISKKNIETPPTKKTTPTVQKKSKSQPLQTLGNHIKPKLETPKPNLNKIAEKIIKNKPTDDNSFFQI